MPSLTDIIDMFGEFGFTETDVRSSLAVGDSAHNAFEGLKARLQIKWAELGQELSADQQRELRLTYDRLMTITMTARTTTASKRAEDRRRVSSLSDMFSTRLGAHRKRMGEEFVSTVRDQLRKQKRADGMSPEAERRARSMGFFEEDEEI